MGEKITRKKEKQMKFGPIPVEICLEDLMIQEAKSGAKKFQMEEREDKVFVLRWGGKCVCLSVKTEAEVKSLRKTLKMFCREINRRIKNGEFDTKPKT